MELVVNIPTAGRPDLLHRTLNSLAECQKPPEYKETVIIENGPRAGAEAVVQSAPPALNARYLYVQTPNKSAALNAILATLGDCLIIFLDDDVRLDASALCAYSDAAKKAGAGHFFGGPTAVDYELPPVTWLRQYLPGSAQGWEWTGDENHVDQPRFLGFNWAAYAADLRAAGGFNIDRGPGALSGSTGQESEMQRRLLIRGLMGIYVAAARTWHYVPKDRCSEQWAIARNFRHGVEHGALTAAESPGSFTRPLAWAVRKYLTGIVKGVRWSMSKNPEVRFTVKFRRSYDIGVLHGIRNEHKNKSNRP